MKYAIENRSSGCSSLIVVIADIDSSSGVVRGSLS